MSSPSAHPRRSLRIRRPPGTESAGTPQVPQVPAGRGRPRRLVLVAVAVVTVVVAVAAWFVVGGRDTLTAATERVPSPTPTLSPAPRSTLPFATVLPSTVLQYALLASADNGEWLAVGALEAYLEEFGDGGSSTFTLRAGQWATVDEAATAFDGFTAGATLLAGGTLRPTGSILADGVEVGTYLVADIGGGNATVTWANSTAVLQLTGPVAEVEQVFRAFPV
ncbi:MAG: hypothetical protein FWH11_01545 [Micrococcales bacterium]|nr:hypothetical protein [Micrococcales bacterium]